MTTSSPGRSLCHGSPSVGGEGERTGAVGGVCVCLEEEKGGEMDHWTYISRRQKERERERERETEAF